ncbi:MAG TPA: 4'-phosphopantetheinyl transferase superfamily protein [Candidatus Angelobacter sp.]|nr:4'-phosphopantetheinyl transferase superfamily protein [Candidatus Angelobacter sp.]
MIENITSSSADEGVRLDVGQVHVWRISLAENEGAVQRCRVLLSSDEKERASRFYFEKHRRRFVLGRGAMRQILGRYLQLGPEKLVFSYGSKGKPELAECPNGPQIRFNLSNSDDLAVLAVTHEHQVGIDVEFINREFASEEIAHRFFSAHEVNTLRAVSPDQRAEAFFSCWTRKEAYIKAVGEGLSIPLDSFDVAFGADVPAALLEVRNAPEGQPQWSMYDLAVPPEFRAALVVEGEGHRLRHFQWKAE